MLNFIRSLPYILVLTVAGGLYHWYEVNKLKNNISIAEQRVDKLEADVQTYKLANQTQQDTISDLEKKNKDQNTRISALTTRNQVLETEKEDYLAIFRRHDLTNLSRVKPGLIEPRINKGTSEILRQIEEDSRAQLQHEETKNETDPYRNFVYTLP